MGFGKKKKKKNIFGIAGEKNLTRGSGEGCA
jgi:hypothetical protein